MNATKELDLSGRCVGGREAYISTFSEFQANDEMQKLFGALSVGKDIADLQILNESSLAEYCNQVDETLDFLLGQSERVSHNKSASELYRSLKALRSIHDWATCEQIASTTASFGRPVRKYNTNRALKAVPEFAERLNTKSDKLRYRITDRGELLVELMDLP